MSVQTHKLIVDKKYFFSFHEDISTLNGVYSVLAIQNFQEVEKLLSDPVHDLYAMVNKLDIYDNQQLGAKYRYEVFYKLQSTENEEVIIFVPDSLIVDYPLSDFKEMPEYVLYVQIGILDDPEELKALAPVINQTVMQNIGIDPVTSIATYNKLYLSPEVIKDHTDTRNAQKRAKTVHAQLAEAQTEVKRLKAIVAKYETIIVGYEESKS